MLINPNISTYFKFAKRVKSSKKKLRKIFLKLRHKKKDIIGREDNFNKIEIDKSFPIYLQNNINLYKDWIDE